MKLTLIFALISLCSYAQEPEMYSIYFDFNSSSPILVLNGESSSYKPFAANTRIVKLEAFCDSTGSFSYNKDLAEKRLSAVTKLLEASGYSTQNATKSAVGESEKINKLKTAKESRRVDIYYIEPNIKKSNVGDASLSQVEIKYKESDSTPTVIDFSKDAIQAFAKSDETELHLDMNILFVNASDKVLPESNGLLEELLEMLQKYPDLDAEIHGHVCCTYNYDISVARALTVVKYLIKNDIEKERLIYEGHSNEQPKVWPEVTDEDRKMNRRVTIVLKK